MADEKETLEDGLGSESGFVASEAEGGSEASAEAPVESLVGAKRGAKPFVKKAGLTKAFGTSARDQLQESRDRELSLTNLIGQQNKLIEQLTTRLTAVETNASAMRAEAVRAKESEMLAKTGVKKIGDHLHGKGAMVTPTSNFNIPSLEPIVSPTEDEGEATTFSSGYDGEIPFVIHNPHRMQVRIHDLKMNPQDKEDVGLLLEPFTTVDLREYFPEKQISSSRGLRHVLSKGILVAAAEGAQIGRPSQEPDSVQKRLAKAIGKVPRRGKIQRNARTGKIEREQGINDPELETAVRQHVQQETVYDKELFEAREYEESGSNIV